ncbi:Shedu immune nuclease family protein [Rubrivirga sp.]|uniref:Shedu immune nuclease family protein n=1 Tax=Rubrivirga sp. TaxID=1885344 RepID=UPI003C770CDC
MDDYQNPIPGKTYVSPPITDFSGSGRRLRIANRMIDQEQSFALGTERNEVVLRRTHGGDVQLQLKFWDIDRSIKLITLQTYNSATDKPHNASISLTGNEIDQFILMLRHVQHTALSSNGRTVISDSPTPLDELTSSDLKEVVASRSAEIADILLDTVTESDLVAIGYRRSQLAHFERLLYETGFAASEATRLKKRGLEAVWQNFFEQNHWIFGYALTLIWHDSLGERKLEQVVSGSSLVKHGKRSDAVLASRAAISNVCLVEIKKPDTDLLDYREHYRPGCWRVSQEMAGAVSQAQITLDYAVRELQSSFKLTDDRGFPQGNDIFAYQPRCYLIVGRTDQFSGEHGVNRDQLRSFELFRSSVKRPEIVTYDELYERTKMIIEAD